MPRQGNRASSYTGRMQQNTASLTLILLALAACASAPLPEALLPYADAARFLLPGQQSRLFHREAVAGDDDPENPVSAPVASCGSDFAPPMHVGSGPFRGVTVWDLGAGGLAGARAGRAAVIYSLQPPRIEAAAAIAGCPVWHEPATGQRSATWCAHVEDRFVVWSYDRDDLTAALARPGQLAELLRPFATVHALPADAESIVCALPRPEPKRSVAAWLTGGAPTPAEPTVSCFRPAPWRLLVWHKRPLPEMYALPFQRLGGSTATPAGEWTVTTGVQTENEPEVHEPIRGLVCAGLFGLAVFL
jgi:hypothetical protein